MNKELIEAINLLEKENNISKDARGVGGREYPCRGVGF